MKIMIMENKKIKAIIITVIVALGAVLLFMVLSAKEKIVVQVKVVKEDSKPFSDIKINAKSAYVFDIVQGKTIFEFNSGSQLPLASLTKLMTAVVVEENLSREYSFGIPLEAIAQNGDSGFIAGEQWRVGDLMNAMIIASSNDAAFALALAFDFDEQKESDDEFVYLMNNKAKKLGLIQTYFLNPTGLDFSDNVAGGYGSAEDVSALAEYILLEHPSIFDATRQDFINIQSLHFGNTNRLVNSIPRLIGGKTGFTNMAGGNLVVITDIGFERPVIIVVLSSSEDGRFDDVLVLYQETVKWLAES